jgi:hypothetical protein
MNHIGTTHRGAAMPKLYAICETVDDETLHVRELSPAGYKYGGGADTPALCSTVVTWDTRIHVNLENITCAGCKVRFVEIQQEEGEANVQI